MKKDYIYCLGCSSWRSNSCDYHLAKEQIGSLKFETAYRELQNIEQDNPPNFGCPDCKNPTYECICKEGPKKAPCRNCGRWEGHYMDCPKRTYGEKPVSDSVNHPSHYNTGKIEVIEALEDWKLDFHTANAVKYCARAGKKDPTKEIEDLEKAIWYIRRKIELLAAVKENREPKRPNDMVKK